MGAIVAQPSSRELLPIFAAQARMLAERAERGLSIDFRSVLNLVRLCLRIEGGLDDDEGADDERERLSPHPIVTPILLQVRDFPTRLHAFCTDLEGIREERRPR